MVMPWNTTKQALVLATTISTIVLVLPIAATAGDSFTGRVVGITDGDTKTGSATWLLTVPSFLGIVLACLVGTAKNAEDACTIKVMREGRAEKVRLHGVDCPERRQAFGTKAKQFTCDIVFGKHVTVEPKGKSYDRLVGRVILPDGRCLNEELVKAGMAWWSEKYAPNDKVLSQAEQEARGAKRGLWRDKDPVPPWNFRKNKKQRVIRPQHNVDGQD